MGNQESALIKEIEMIKELNQANFENNKIYLDKICEKVDQHTANITQLQTALVTSGELFINVLLVS